MRRDFYQVYRDLSEQYLQAEAELGDLRMQNVLVSPPPRLLSLVVADALREAEKRRQLERWVRPDARHLLLVNLHQMVALPLAVAFPQASLGDEIREDAQTILADARQHTSGEEITGRHVLDAVTRTWGQLRTARRDIWG